MYQINHYKTYEHRIGENLIIEAQKEKLSELKPQNFPFDFRFLQTTLKTSSEAAHKKLFSLDPEPDLNDKNALAGL